jgi:hypothetical protein
VGVPVLVSHATPDIPGEDSHPAKLSGAARYGQTILEYEALAESRKAEASFVRRFDPAIIAKSLGVICPDDRG